MWAIQVLPLTPKRPGAGGKEINAEGMYLLPGRYARAIGGFKEPIGTMSLCYGLPMV